MRNKGFTLIELMVVVVVMGILMALGAVQFNSMINRGRIRGAADKISREILSAREKAVSGGQAITLTFSVSPKGGLMITSPLGSAPFDDCRFALNAGITAKAPETGSGAPALADGFGGTCTFWPQGTGNVGAVYIRSLDARYQYAVSVNANGRVSRWEWTGAGWK
jgi:prepilin-type N-terminal cleavage/methylation domain-containing protein